MITIGPDVVQVNIHNFSFIKTCCLEKGEEKSYYVPLLELSFYESKKLANPLRPFYTCNLCPGESLRFYEEENLYNGDIIIHMQNWVQSLLDRNIVVVFGNYAVHYAKLGFPRNVVGNGTILRAAEVTPLIWKAINCINTFAEIWESNVLEFSIMFESIKDGVVTSQKFIEETRSLIGYVETMEKHGYKAIDIQSEQPSGPSLEPLYDFQYIREYVDKFYVLSIQEDGEPGYSYFAGSLNRCKAEDKFIAMVDTIEESCHFPSEDSVLKFIENKLGMTSRYTYEIMEINKPEYLRIRPWFCM